MVIAPLMVPTSWDTTQPVAGHIPSIPLTRRVPISTMMERLTVPTSWDSTQQAAGHTALTISAAVVPRSNVNVEHSTDYCIVNVNFLLLIKEVVR